MALTNVFRPSTLGFNAYGWKGSPQYNRADVPTQWVQGATDADRVIIEQQLAYEWLNSGGDSPGSNMVSFSTNPPFLAGAAGRLLPGLQAPAGGGPPRILRGFIRRAESDISDPAASARLYFMFNPETITRDYVSYLDQGALDPFNTVFQSGNLVAPPSYMDFTFSLLFDRQEECSDRTHPGVFVDYQYFDLVVRNVIPASDPNAMTSALPDNGVMMVNPRDITVIFSPQITIQGRPSNARVSFQKFTHRMVPTRMQIDLTMRVVYFGPLKDMNPYVKDTNVTASTVPLDEFQDPLGISPQDMVRFFGEFTTSISNIANAVTGDTSSGGTATGIITTVEIGSRVYPDGTPQEAINMAESSIAANKQVMDYAESQVLAQVPTTRYSKVVNMWVQGDCSALVTKGYEDKGQLGRMNWSRLTSKGTSTAIMWTDYRNKVVNTPYAPVALLVVCPEGAALNDRKKYWDARSHLLAPGDILFRVNAPEAGEDHVAWFYKWVDPTLAGPGGKPWVFDAAGPGLNPPVGSRPISYSGLYNFTAAVRPLMVQ